MIMIVIRAKRHANVNFPARNMCHSARLTLYDGIRFAVKKKKKCCSRGSAETRLLQRAVKLEISYNCY
jgi:hypothetical protein